MKKMVLCFFVMIVFVSFSVCSEAEDYAGYFIDQKTPSSSHGSIRPLGDYVFAQSFVPSEANVAAVSFATGPMPEMNFYPYSIIEIWPDDDGFPGGVVLDSSSSFTTDLRPLGVTAAIFEPPVAVIPGATYYFVIYKNSSAPYEIVVWGATGEDYPNGQGYYKLPDGEWEIGVVSYGLPPGLNGADYGFTEYYYGETTIPIADAGEDVYANANETVILDASGSYDPDGTIANYMWSTLPARGAGPYFTGEIIYCGPEPTCEAQALGRLEEVIQLTVTDDLGVTATDTATIWHRKVEYIDIKQGPPGPPGPPGPQGEEGPAGVTPDEIQMIYENRELLGQLPQLQKDLEVLQQETE